MAKRKAITLGHTFFLISTFCLVIAILVVGKPILAPIALSILFAFVLNPVVRYFETIGLGRGFAVGIIVTIVVTTLFGLSSALVSQLQHMAMDLPTHSQELENKIASLRGSSEGMFSRVWEMADRLAATYAEPTEKREESQPTIVVQQTQSNFGISALPGFVVPVLEPIAIAALVVVLTIFLLFSREDLRNRMLAIIGQTRLSSTTRILDDTSARLSKYLLGLVSVNLGFSILFTLLLFVIGVPYAAVWGSVSFFFRFVPLLGSAVSMLLPLAVSITTLPGWLPPIAVIGGYLALEGFTGNFIEPWLFGRSVGMNPFALLIAIMFWTWAWGPLGLMLATPLSLIIVTLGRHVSHFAALDYLLGDTRPLPPHVVFFQRLLAADIVEATKLLQDVSKAKGSAYAAQRVVINGLHHADRELRNKAISREAHAKYVSAADEVVRSVFSSDDQSAISSSETAGRVGQTTPFPELVVIGEGRASITMEVLIKSQPAATWRQHPVLNQRLADRLTKEAVPLIILCAVAPNRLADLEASCRLLRRQGYQGWMAVGYWKSTTIDSDARQQLKQAGADYVTHRLHAMVRMVAHFIERLQQDAKDVEEVLSLQPDTRTLITGPHTIKSQPVTGRVPA